MLRWECYINEAFKVQSWVEIVGMMSGLKGDFLNNLPFIRSMFKKHVVVQGSTERITSVSEAQAYLLIISVRESPPVFFWKKS